MPPLSTGKLPPLHLAALLGRFTTTDPAVRLGPGLGRDCAVLDLGGGDLLVAKTDPITFAADAIGWYAVHVNANDLATTGATPRWFMATLLLPPGIELAAVAAIFDQLQTACAAIGVTVVGGHTEVTYDLPRPIIAGTLLGTVPLDRLVLPTAARPGDVLLLTKRLAVEATSLIARDKAADLAGAFSAEFLTRCQGFLHTPGISVITEARCAQDAGRVHAMHDPTEGGLATALLELAAASQVELLIEADAVLIYPETRALCDHFGLDPWGVIASGSLLLAVEAATAADIITRVQERGIEIARIGRVGEKTDRPEVWLKRAGHRSAVSRFERDEIARLFGSG